MTKKNKKKHPFANHPLFLYVTKLTRMSINVASHSNSKEYRKVANIIMKAQILLSSAIGKELVNERPKPPQNEYTSTDNIDPNKSYKDLARDLIKEIDSYPKVPTKDEF